MKLVGSMVLLCVAFATVSCGDDDGPAAPAPDSGTETPDAGHVDAARSRCEAVDCVVGSQCNEADGACHCGSADGPLCDADETCRPDTARCDPALPDPVCNAGTRWAPGTLAFRDATTDWGLDVLGVEGTRVAVADIDGDGFADLFVRRGGLGSDDFSEGGVRQSWLLRNTGDGHLEDVTESSGIRARRTPEGSLGRPGEVVAFGDIDGDGDLDVVTGGSGPGGDERVFINDHNGNGGT